MVFANVHLYRVAKGFVNRIYYPSYQQASGGAIKVTESVSFIRFLTLYRYLPDLGLLLELDKESQCLLAQTFCVRLL